MGYERGFPPKDVTNVVSISDEKLGTFYETELCKYIIPHSPYGRGLFAKRIPRMVFRSMLYRMAPTCATTFRVCAFALATVSSRASTISRITATRVYSYNNLSRQFTNRKSAITAYYVIYSEGIIFVLGFFGSDITVYNYT